MLRARTLVCFVAIGLCSVARASLDLTPTLREYVSAGVTNRELLFKDNGREISYAPPPQWTWRGSSNALVLMPPVSQAEAVIEQKPLTASRPMGASQTGEILERAIQSLPEGSTNVVVVEQQENPVILGGNSTLGVILSYEAFGQAFTKSFVFLRLPESELVFRCTARKSEFDALQKSFRASLFSWQWNETKMRDSTTSAPKI